MCARARWIYDYIHGVFHAILPAKMSRNNRFIMERAAEGSRRKCEAETREAELVLSALFAGRGKSKASLLSARTHLLGRKESAPARQFITRRLQSTSNCDFLPATISQPRA